MKILWLINIPLPQATRALGIDEVIGGGWLIGQLNALIKYTVGNRIYICSPTGLVKNITKITIDNVEHILFPKNPLIYETLFPAFIKEIEPDVIHIFGTEQEHSLAMLQAVKKKNVVVSIQGLVSVYAKHYFANLPTKYHFVNPIKYLIQKVYCADIISCAQKEFERNGENEKKMLLQAPYVLGRTSWDKACVCQINPGIKYFHCGEILRDEFYRADNRWSASKCQRHTIFFSQCWYPVKGLHCILKVLPMLIMKYPDLHLYVAGHGFKTLHNKILDKGVDFFFEYQGYLKKIIHKNNLENYVTFLGPLSEKEVVKQFQRANVFLCASSIENSPNSLGEAMLLGVPCVSSMVGGVQDMLSDKNEGFLYPFDEPYMAIEYISRIFDDDALAERLSNAALKRAQITHNTIEITKELNSIYEKIAYMEDD